MTDANSAAPEPVGGWQTATVSAIHRETATAKTFSLRLARRTPYLAGQHLILRLSAPDGYMASRSYSIASAPDDDEAVDLTIERLRDGEVSAFLHDDVVVGDDLEVRGPIGGWFVWKGDTPATLIGGGSGVVPLMAMLRLARRLDRAADVRLLVSVRTPEDLYYSSELPGPETTIVYTRAASPDSARPPGRVAKTDVAPLISPDSTVYICGSSGFAEAATALVMDCGVPADRVRIERFGPTG